MALAGWKPRPGGLRGNLAPPPKNRNLLDLAPRPGYRDVSDRKRRSSGEEMALMESKEHVLD